MRFRHLFQLSREELKAINNNSKKWRKINAPRSHIKAVKAKSKTSKTGALTKELMNKAVRHIAEEIVAAKP